MRSVVCFVRVVVVAPLALAVAVAVPAPAPAPAALSPLSLLKNESERPDGLLGDDGLDVDKGDDGSTGASARRFEADPRDTSGAWSLNK